MKFVTKIFLLCALLFSSSCAQFGLALLAGSSKTGSGPHHYKYRCKNPGDCCEVGKDCKEEDVKKDDTKK